MVMSMVGAVAKLGAEAMLWCHPVQTWLCSRARDPHREEHFD